MILEKIRKYRGVLESPRALKVAATPLYKVIPSIPRHVTLIYAIESLIIVEGVSSSLNRTGARKKAIAMIATDTIEST
jgi:hypothetical protein